MSSKTIYHYVYRITNLVERKHYYGKRSSKILPQDDIGIKYFSSSYDKNFMIDQKQNPQNYRYKVVAVFDSVEDALDREIKLHEMFDVGRNLSFYNQRKQTSTRFDGTGFVHVKDIDGNRFVVSKDDPRYLSGEFKFICVGMVTVKNSNGEWARVSIDDQRYLSGELVHIFTGNTNTAEHIVVKDCNGITSLVKLDDPRYLSGELKFIWEDKQHTKETISKMKETHRKNGHSQGEKNSQYGTMWITDGKNNKKVAKDAEIQDGWYKGRKIRK